MAAEERVEEIEAAPQTSKLKWIVIGLVLLVVLAALAVGGLVAYSKFVAPKQEEKAAAAGQQGANPAEGQAKGEEAPGPVPKLETTLGTIRMLDPFVVNLSDASGKRYIRVTISLELSSKELDQEITSKLPMLQDSIITILSSKTSEEVLTVEGKFQAKEEVLTRVNSILKSGVVKNVFFTEFVIQ